MSIEDEHSAPKPSTRREFHVLSHLTNTIDPKFHETAIAYFVKRIPDLLKTEKEKNFDISTPRLYRMEPTNDRIYNIDKSVYPEVWSEINRIVPNIDLDKRDFSKFVIALIFNDGALITLSVERDEVEFFEDSVNEDAGVRFIQKSSDKEATPNTSTFTVWRQNYEKCCLNCGKTPGRLFVCGRCKKAYYCERGCQRADWKTHKNECREMKD